MKKIMIALAGLAMIASLAVTGCNKEQKALDAMGQKLCADNGKDFGRMLFNKTMFEFMTRVEAVSGGASEADIEKEVEQALKMFGMMKDEAGKDMSLASCSAKAEPMKCEAIYKEIAGSENGKRIKDAEKTLAAVGDKMGIKDCGKIAITGKEKEGEKEETGIAYVGKAGEEYSVFFLQEPK